MRAGLLSLLLVLAISSFGAAPTVDQVYPAALAVGSSNTLQVVGKFDPWPPKVWVDVPGIVFKPETNSGKFSVIVSSNAPAGPHLLRLYNEQGASEPRFLIVATEPQTAEKEPNDDFSKAQTLSHLPAQVNGRLDKSGDVDSYAVELEAGQTLVASVECFVLMSPVDAVLRLVDTNGLQVAFNHDDTRTLDPFLAFTARQKGTYILQMFGFSHPATSEIRFTGGNACVYRLHLSKGPYLHHTLPFAAVRGKAETFELVGWNLEKGTKRKVQPDELSSEKNQIGFGQPAFQNTLLVPVLDIPELREMEPNNASNIAQQVEAPCALTGCIEKPGDVDVFRFSAKKGEQWVFQAQSAALGFSLDAWLRVEDEQGKELARNDDTLGPDPKLDWTAPSNSAYLLSIGNVVRRGGDDYYYHLLIHRAVPGWKATVASSSFTIEPGKTNEVKVSLKRLGGFKGKLKIQAGELPEGVKMEPVEVSEKSNEATLQLVALEKATPFSGPFQLAAASPDGKAREPVINEFVVTSLNNGVPTGFHKLVIENTDQLWLTVLQKVEKKAEKGKK